MATDSQQCVKRQLNGILIPHSIVTIHGQLKHDPDRFAVDFMKDDTTASLHLNVRFKEGKGIICNNKNDNVWGNEEFQSDISAFYPGKAFKMDFECLEDSFKVSVNDKCLLTFNARKKLLKDINYITIWGDIQVHGFSVKLM
ncbi:galectin-3 [Microcaecilia unicolor]|uniref:Galectin n=1 Tax=Microcaecilia unicolor TaxID=1415580 RepID=A0A6P7Z653_9AMPH|nr:galectin-3-like [Microcaecilia unicolor]